MRGTWEGSGTFRTGDDGVQTMAYCLIGGVLVVAGASWVLRHMLWLAIPAGILIAASAGTLTWWWLGRHRREALAAASFAAQRQAFEAARAPRIRRAPQQPALEQHVHYHVHLADGGREIPVSAIKGKVLP